MFVVNGFLTRCLTGLRLIVIEKCKRRGDWISRPCTLVFRDDFPKTSLYIVLVEPVTYRDRRRRQPDDKFIAVCVGKHPRSFAGARAAPGGEADSKVQIK